MDGRDSRELTALLRIAVALERIADTLPKFAPEDEPGEMACLHPIETRESFGVTDGREDWLCRECGFRSVPEQETVGCR